MKHEPTEEDAILNAIGALTEEERLEFEQQMSQAAPEIQQPSTEFQDLAGLIGSQGPVEQSPPSFLKQKTLEKAFASTIALDGFTFIGTPGTHC